MTAPGWLRLAAVLLALPALLVGCEAGDKATPAPSQAPSSAPSPAPPPSAPPSTGNAPGSRASAGVTVSAQASAVAVDCHTFASSPSAGATGKATPRQAIDAFIRSGRASFTLPKTGWQGPAGAGRFTSGRASVTVVALPGSSGFLVDTATSC